MSTVLLTGAGGRMASTIRPLLLDRGLNLILVDVRPFTTERPEERAVVGSMTDLRLMAELAAEADVIVHLGGHSSERPWPEILATNIDGARTVLEAAHSAQVSSVLLASSIHAVGYVPVAEAHTVDVLPPRPDTFYGVGKVAQEALASLYADRLHMAIVSARIGTFAPEPTNERTLSTWLSPADTVRLIEATMALSTPGHRVVAAISNNTRRWFSLEAGWRMGYRPQDDAEWYADRIGAPAPAAPTELTVLGGPFVDEAHPLGVHW